MDNYYAMIMAGGGGTRLWPMSRQQTPKQMLPLVEDDSMFATTVKRLFPLFSPDRIYVVTGTAYAKTLQSHAPQIPARNFIIEPYGKDSGPAAALGMAVIQKRDPSAVVSVLTADHHIADEAKFRSVLETAYQVAADQDFVVTLGISPSYPSTGFGYIQRGNYLGEMNGFNYYHSVGFKEKPRADLAIEYLRSGRYSWNSGMFIWRAQRAMEEFKRQRPVLHQHLRTIHDTVDTPAYDETVQQVWDKIERISLDYAVMEGVEKMCVIPIDIGWSDVGTWGALYDILDHDRAGNSFRGTADARVNIDTQETFVFSDRLVVTVGVRDVVVIDTEDALLICHADRTQEVKNVVNQLKADDRKEYL